MLRRPQTSEGQPLLRRSRATVRYNNLVDPVACTIQQDERFFYSTTKQQVLGVLSRLYDPPLAVSNALAQFHATLSRRDGFVTMQAVGRGKLLGVEVDQHRLASLRQLCDRLFGAPQMLHCKRYIGNRLIVDFGVLQCQKHAGISRRVQLSGVLEQPDGSFEAMDHLNKIDWKPCIAEPPLERGPALRFHTLTFHQVQSRLPMTRGFFK